MTNGKRAGVTEAATIPTHFPGLLGPAIAAFVMTAAVQGRTGVHGLAARIGRWHVAPRWYLIAVATPPAFFAVAARDVAMVAPLVLRAAARLRRC